MFHLQAPVNVLSLEATVAGLAPVAGGLVAAGLSGLQG